LTQFQVTKKKKKPNEKTTDQKTTEIRGRETGGPIQEEKGHLFTAKKGGEREGSDTPIGHITKTEKRGSGYQIYLRDANIGKT